VPTPPDGQSDDLPVDESAERRRGFHMRAAFYYPWFNGDWGGHTRYHPTLGYYKSANKAIVRRHIRAMQYAHISAGIASWWRDRRTGPFTSRMLPQLLQYSRGTGFRWAVHYEREGYMDPPVRQLRSDLLYLKLMSRHPNFLKINGRFVVFVWTQHHDMCNMARRWQTASRGLGAYIVLRPFANYRRCAVGVGDWYQYSGARNGGINRAGNSSVTLTPGFWKKRERRPLLARNPRRWSQQVREMARSRVRWELVSTFNEWTEGTAVESARQWRTRSGFGAYLDALHRNP
jgi:hypothetical protein